MKNNLKVSNIVMSGRIPMVKERISVEQFDNLINRLNWQEVSIGENYSSRFSKRFPRKKKEISNHHKVKGPYVTIFALGGIIIVGLKSKKEANEIYDLVIKDLKKIGVKLK